MTIELTKEKKEKIAALCEELLNATNISIRQLAKVIGNLVASFPAVPYGKLFYRNLEKDKIISLKQNKGDFDKTCQLSVASVDELNWWIKNIPKSIDVIHKAPIDITIYTDASKTGWGISDGIIPSGGIWSTDDALKHINVLELEANYIGVVTYCKDKHYKHARIMTDNSTAISYINNMGGTKSADCNRIAQKIWKWAIEEKIWISAAFVPGKENKTADEKSRKFNEAIEWMLNPDVFLKITKTFGIPDVDLFATRINRQIDTYVSWLPEPEAKAIDAFSIKWDTGFIYMFPPFSLIGKVLAKVEREKANVLLIIPDWPTQTWYPQIWKLVSIPPLHLKPSQKLLVLAHNPTALHPLWKKLKLLAVHIKANVLLIIPDWPTQTWYPHKSGNSYLYHHCI